MSVALITGSAGLVGAEAVRHFARRGMEVVGLDNDMRRYFFGAEASTAWMRRHLVASVPRYQHYEIDVRDQDAVFGLFRRFGRDIILVIHTAAQPSHDWAAREPFTDFAINANGTLNLLEATRQFCPEAVFIFTSTNKVYGDTPNRLPLLEQATRWEIDPQHPFAAHGICEEMAIDHSMHSLFGASKLAADVLTQEYGRYFHLRTGCFRCGCVTGPDHSGTMLHGFLSYLMRSAMTGVSYKVLGYKGKQVRDNIHTSDLIAAFDAFFTAPRAAAVYNIGGGRFSNCSLLEAIALCEQITGHELDWKYEETNRAGDHIWWISDIRRFQSDHPSYRLTYDVPAILREIYEKNLDRWRRPARAAEV